ncbi:protein kinase [Streptomyces sp. NPDC005423]|uniref:serine/threonine-protein kinase n=1 Tax=Streptomyces sp. NPDC005423 TaxID=3155343 RepID=UPI0033BAA4A6
MDKLETGDPHRIGGYRLLARLGAGGMGRVYLARSDRGRTVAVKLVRRELAAREEFRARFRQEVAAARRVGGYWTAPVLDADTEADVPWVATGYVAGPSLQEIVGHDHGALPERSVRILAAGLAHALRDIHAAGLIHRDLKPSNVLLTIDGPRVIDFGIARALETADGDGLTRTGSLVGSPGFMAPEQVRGDRVTPACDVFCLGSLLVYAATGTLPFGTADSSVHALMFRIAQEEPDLTGVPESIADLVRDCLRKAPAARPTPDHILTRTGAEDTVSGGRAHDPWLPASLVAQLGRHAVHLLNTEDPPGEAGTEPAETEPAGTEPAGTEPAGTRPVPETTEPDTSSTTAAAQVPDPRTEFGPAPGDPTTTAHPTTTAPASGPAPVFGPGGEPPPGEASRETFPHASPYASPHASPEHGPLPEDLPAVAAPQGFAEQAPAGKQGSTFRGYEATVVPGAAGGGAAAGERPAGGSPPYGAARQHPQPGRGHGYPPRDPRPAAYGYPYGGAASDEDPRRSGRSTALLVVVAVVVALGSGGSVYALLHDGGETHDGGRTTVSKSPATTAPPASPTGPEDANAAPSSTGTVGAGVPNAYLGSWSSVIDNAAGHNTRRLTIRQGKVGEDVLTLVAEGPSYHCEFAAELTQQPTSNGPLEFGASNVTSGTPPSSCTPGRPTEISLLADGTLQRVDTTDGEELTYTRSG